MRPETQIRMEHWRDCSGAPLKLFAYEVKSRSEVSLDLCASFE